MHRRAITATFDPDAFCNGMYFCRDDDQYLHVASSVQALRPFNGDHLARLHDPTLWIHLGNAHVWRPRPLHSGLIVPRGAVLSRAPAPNVNVSFERLAPFLISMQDACRSHNLSRVLEIGRDLIGLGPGLTPSGDDFLGGLLLTIHQLLAAYPGGIEWSLRAVEDFLAWARPRTNVISYTILCDHARGQGAEPLHALLAALLEGKSDDEIARHRERVLAIGSTSGAEMLAGILAGLNILHD